MDSQAAADMSARVHVGGRLSPFRSARNEGTFDLCRYYHILRVEFSVRDAEILAVSPPTDRMAAVLYSLKRILSAGADRVFTVKNAPNVSTSACIVIYVYLSFRRFLNVSQEFSLSCNNIRDKAVIVIQPVV